MTINDLGSGIGYIYITEGSVVISNIPNNKRGKRLVLKDAVINGALVDNHTSFNEGRRYYINTTGEQGSISGATEITEKISHISLTNRFPVGRAMVSSGIITYDRIGSIQRLDIDTESLAATSNVIGFLETNTEHSDGDILILRASSPTQVTTFLDADSAEAELENGGSAVTFQGKLALENNAEFYTGDYSRNLTIMFSSSDSTWYELSRTPGNVVDITTLRTAGVAIKLPGTHLISSISAGDSFTPNEDTTPGVIAITGTHDLIAGNFTINLPSGGTPIEGDEYVVVYQANITTTGVVSILGTTMDTEEYGFGSTTNLEIKSKYIHSAWTPGIVLKDTRALEDDLGTPASNGMILTSDVDNQRTWIAPGGFEDDLGLPANLGMYLSSDLTGHRTWEDFPSGYTVPIPTLGGKVLISDSFGGASWLNYAPETYLGAPAQSGYVLTSDTGSNRSWVPYNAEDDLGFPTQSGMILSSDTAGHRSWIANDKEDDLGFPGANGMILSSDELGHRSWIVNDKEDGLGVPTVDGMVLASQVDGSRSWITLMNPSKLKYKEFTYRVSTNGGTVGTVYLTDSSGIAPIGFLPTNSIIDASLSYILTDNDLAFAGLSSTVSIGINPTSSGFSNDISTDADFFLTSTLSSTFAGKKVYKGASNIGYLSDDASISLTIGTDDLTAGDLTVVVAYYEL